MQKPKKLPRDPNSLAAQIVALSTGQPLPQLTESGIDHGALSIPAKPEKNPAAVALGRLGGLRGGKSRAARLTAEQRSDIARKGAQQRWSKKA
jgi:hypothetical protein